LVLVSIATGKIEQIIGGGLPVNLQDFMVSIRAIMQTVYQIYILYTVNAAYHCKALRGQVEV